VCFLGGCDFSANKQTLFVVCSRHACFVCFWVCCCCCCCCLLLLLSVLHLVCPRWLDFIWAVWRRLDSILTILGRLDLIWVVCLWICVMTCRLGHWRSWGSGKEDKHRDEIHIPCKDTDVGKEEGVSKRHCTCKLCNSVVREAPGSLCKFWHEHHHHPGWPPCLHDEMMMLHHLLHCHHTPLCSAPADSMQPPAVVLAEDWTLVQLSWLGKSWPCSPSDVLPDSLASHALLVVSFVASSSQVPSLSPVVAMTLLPQQQQQMPVSAVASSLPVVASIAHPERKRSTQNPFFIMSQTWEQQQHYRYAKPPVAKFRKKWSKSSAWVRLGEKISTSRSCTSTCTLKNCSISSLCCCNCMFKSSPTA